MVSTIDHIWKDRRWWWNYIVVGGVVGFIFLFNSATVPFATPNSNETFVVINTLKFGATHSLEPSPYLAYGTLYLYLLLGIYGLWYAIGLLGGVYKDSLDFAIQFFVNPFPFYIVGRVLSAAFATGSVVLVYMMGKRFWKSEVVGILAGLLLLLDKVHFMRAQAVLPDAAVTFFSTAFIYFGLRILEDGRTKDYVLAGIAAGLIVGTKINGALVLVALPIVHWLRCEDKSVRGLLNNSVVVFAVSFVVTVFVVHPYMFLKFQEVLGLVLRDKTKAFTEVKGSEEVEYLWIFGRLVKDNGGRGILYIVGLVYGVYWMARESKLHVTLVPVVIAFVLVIGGNSIHNIHFVLPVIPVLSLLAAESIKEAGSLSERWPYRAAVVGGVVVGIAISTSNLGAFVRESFESSPQEKAGKWIRENIPGEKLIAVDSYEDGPEILTVDRYLSAERLQDYRTYLPGGLVERLEEYARTHWPYSTVRVKYYHAEPRWPASFSREQIQGFAGDIFMEGEYRRDWRTLEELRRLGVSYIVTSRQLTTSEKSKYPEDHVLYPAHQKTLRFYDSLKRENGVVEMARFGDIVVFELR